MLIYNMKGKNYVVVHTSFTLAPEEYEKMLEKMKREGIKKVGTYLKRLVLQDIQKF